LLFIAHSIGKYFSSLPCRENNRISRRKRFRKNYTHLAALTLPRTKSGEIYVNGVNLSEIPLQTWRDNLAWVPQNPYLFNDTVAANIKLACPGASDALVKDAARLAHADEFIEKLPQGYATMIGERGARLSSGQAQRIALAVHF